MKRVIAITILTLLTLALCGCGKAEAGIIDCGYWMGVRRMEYMSITSRGYNT